MDSSDDFQLQIPRSVVDALALPEGRKKDELQRELAGMSKQALGKLLGDRKIERHYGPEELEEDLRYARGENDHEDKASAAA